MTQPQIPIPIEAAAPFLAAPAPAPAPEPDTTTAALYRQLLTSLNAMPHQELSALMEASVYSFRQSDTLTRAIKECGTIELFGDKWPLTFDFLPTSAEALSLVRAIADQFSIRQLHPCWQKLLTTSTDIQKKALIEAIAYAQHYSCKVLEAVSECEFLDLFLTSEHLNVWMSESEALQMIRLLSGSLLVQSSETLPNVGDGRDDR
ncbi:MAG: hypothetical protein JGK03_15540 [Microcoleus sp. PH2017_25_DOB_D_A]|uniref:hypothetical protein n=1 Tax=unclassified Microcoleus TaxID=2642155 RepID=UPI001D5CEE24|nr:MULTISPECIES: hypothetical protein [unclassified Microcoleus]MCC3535586.1 hypothetical protein [Microcoleus sp. PH2017_25_DOB_D_A]MCC3545445.1 hypothetical protein [Microcoleus sp. PH2017_24_DOB_U_A]